MRRTVEVTALVATFVTVTCASSVYAAFPGTNGRLVFETGTPELPTIAHAPPDGFLSSPVFDTGQQRDATWAPDGLTLAYTAITPQGDDDVYVRDPDGRVRAVAPSTASDTDPAFSPDGRRLAFTSRRDGDPEIYTVAVDGTDLQRLTNAPGVDQQPAWSTRGEIAFSSDRADGNLDLWVMGANGQGPRRLTSDAGTEADPSWAPDGARLAFTTGSPGNWRIAVLPDAGGAAEPLPIDRSMHFPAWSPDGQRIAYVTDGPGPPTIRIARAPGGSAEPALPDVYLLGTDVNWGPLPKPAQPDAPPPTTAAVTVTASGAGVLVAPGRSADPVSPLNGSAVIPTGSPVDASEAPVSIVAAGEQAPISATVSGGVLKAARRSSTAEPLTLRLQRRRNPCRKRARASALPPEYTRFHIHSRGRVRAIARFGRASAPGTTWSVTEVCRGTRYAVKDGTIVVTDTRGHDHVLHAPGSLVVRRARTP